MAERKRERKHGQKCCFSQHEGDKSRLKWEKDWEADENGESKRIECSRRSRTDGQTDSRRDGEREIKKVEGREKKERKKERMKQRKKKKKE